MQPIKLFTIGFTGTNAENFFARLRQASVRKIIDTRLWADTQLSGFARKKDLGFFLQHLSQTDYEHRVDLAPTENILKDYKNKQITWHDYQARYLQLLHDRRIADILQPDQTDKNCFLCAEKTPHFCHRRLLAEYLREAWRADVEIVHL